jgi:methyl-accepting chemotaxis protein
MKKSIIFSYFLFCMGFGICMGMIFPVYASFFVEYKSDTAQIFFVVGCLIAGGVVGGLSYAIGKITILKAINTAKDVSVDIINSKNLSKRLSDDSQDLIGEFAASFNRLLGTLQELIHQSRDHAEVLEDSSEKLNTFSAKIQVDTSDKSQSLKTIKGQTQTSFDGAKNIKTSVGELSQSLNIVASSAGEMESRVGDISTQCMQQSKLASDAELGDSEAGKIMENLVHSGNQIGNVTSSIKDIAANIQLLALNASIEAASAGEAGKGFAVVANEVKELSKQTSDATEEIEALVKSIRKDISEAVESMKERSEIILNMAEFTHKIEASVSEQNHLSAELSQSLTTAHAGSTAIETELGMIENGLNAILSATKKLAIAAEKSEDDASHLQQDSKVLENVVRELKAVVLDYS